MRRQGGRRLPALWGCLGLQLLFCGVPLGSSQAPPAAGRCGPGQCGSCRRAASCRSHDGCSWSANVCTSDAAAVNQRPPSPSPARSGSPPAPAPPPDVDNFGVDHSLMSTCMDTYDDAHGAGSCEDLRRAGYRCRSYFCRPGSEYNGFCDEMCGCGACSTGPQCGTTRCMATQVCGCDGQTCEQPARIGDGRCDDELQDTGHLFNCDAHQMDGGDCADLYDRACSVDLDCEEEEVCSCENRCAPTGWLGDHICDNALKRRGHNLDCEKFHSRMGTGDLGDCDESRQCGGVPEHSLWGTLNCHEDEVCSCNFDCEPASWIGDGECDDMNSNGHHLNCESFGFDGGDCSNFTVACQNMQTNAWCESSIASYGCDYQLGSLTIGRLCQLSCSQCEIDSAQAPDTPPQPSPPEIPVRQRCSGIECPEFGTWGTCPVDGTLELNSGCAFSCSEGYIVMGEMPYCDVEANLIGNSARCEPASCLVNVSGMPRSVLLGSCGADTVADGTIELAHGSSCELTCAAGYELVGQQPLCNFGRLTQSVQCIEQPSPPEIPVRQRCSGIECPEFGTWGTCPVDGTLELNSGCAFSCSEGYIVMGEMPYCDVEANLIGNSARCESTSSTGAHLCTTSPESCIIQSVACILICAAVICGLCRLCSRRKMKTGALETSQYADWN